MNIGGHEIYIKSTNNLEHFPDDLRQYLVPGYHGVLVQGPADYIMENGEQIKVTSQNKLPEVADKNFPYDLEIAYTIFYQFPRRFFPQSLARAGIWNFESSMLPPGWHLYHRAIDYILPSSQYSYDIFAKNGIPEDKMLVVPHGVDVNMFNPGIPPFELRTEKKVKFLHNAIPHHRKLHERVLEAYLSAFSGDDDVCLVMKTKFKQPDKDKPFEVDVESVLERAFKGRKNPPEVEIINTYIPDIGSLYTACDAVVSMSAAEGFCLLPNVLVDTINCPKKICNVKENDYVISHLGNERKITKIISHNIKEEIYSIKRMGDFHRLEGTGEHPILLVKKENKKDKVKYAKWSGLKDARVGDLVAIPIPNYSHIPDLDCLFVNDFVCGLQKEKDFRFYKNGYGRKNSNNYKELTSLIGCCEGTVRDVINGKYRHMGSQTSKEILNKVKEIGWKPPQPIKFSNKIEIDERVAEYFGLYVAEGCDDTRGNAIIFSSHKDEKYARDLETEVSKKLFNCSINEKIIGNTGMVTATTRAGSLFLSELFGSKAKNKKIPRFLWNNKYIKYLIRGIFYGDGCANNGTYQFSTSSKQLAFDLFNICLANGILLHVVFCNGKYKSYILSVAKQHNDRFFSWIRPIKYDQEVKIQKKANSYNTIIEGDGHFFVPIQKVEKKYYEGEVYNLEVEEDSSFTSAGMATHNCLPLLEALACDMLVIAPRHGGQLEFLNDDNSLLINAGEMRAGPEMQYWVYNQDAVVGDPDVKHCAELMRRVYENTAGEKARIKEAAEKTTKKFSWENAAQMILDLPIPQKSSRFSEKKKVLHIVPYKMVGGGEVWVKKAIDKLDRNVYEPHIAFVSGISEQMHNLFKDTGAILEDLSEQGKGNALKCLLEATNYNIVHFYNSFGVYNVIRQAWQQGYRCRIVETVHSELVWADSMSKVATRDKLVAVIVSVSNSMGRKLLKNGNRNVVVLPQQVDWDRFKVPRSKEALVGLEVAQDFVVGYVGRLSPEKNLPVLLKCAQMLPDIGFVLVGDGPQRQPLEQATSGLNNIYFAGRQENTENFYAAFDALMLPSTVEGMPLVILEAMTCGTPVIASDVGAVSEVVTDGVNGSLIWNPGSPLLFVKAIKKLKENKDSWNQYSINSRLFAKSMEDKGKEFTINHIYSMLYKGGHD